MKKLTRFFVFVIIFTLLVLPALSFAADFRVGDQPSVRTSEKIENDMYMAGSTVTTSGSISEDFIGGGGNIVINGDVGADVLAGGGNVTILSNVGDDVRVAGGNVVIQGHVGGDVIIGGGQISLGGSGVDGDVMIGGGNIRIDAPVSGKVFIGGGSVYINAPIKGDIDIRADTVTLGSSAVISGTLTYKATKELIKEEGSVVNGKIVFEPRSKNTSKGTFLAIFSVFLVWKFFALLACAMLVGLLLKRYANGVVAIAAKRPLLLLGRGILAQICLPIISILLFATVVGIPLGILGLISFVALMIVSFITTPIIVGSFVYRYFSKKDLEVSWKTITLGVFLSTVIPLVPFIGWLAQLCLMFITLGSVVTFKWRVLKEWR